MSQLATRGGERESSFGCLVRFGYRLFEGGVLPQPLGIVHGALFAFVLGLTFQFAYGGLVSRSLSNGRRSVPGGVLSPPASRCWTDTLLVNTAKLQELDPQAYLVDVLERIVSGQTRSHQLRELLA
jgi:hypothetical protein